MAEIIRWLELIVAYNRQNLVKLVTKILTDENLNRRKYEPTKIIVDMECSRNR